VMSTARPLPKPSPQRPVSTVAFARRDAHRELLLELAVLAGWLAPPLAFVLAGVEPGLGGG